MKTLKTTSVTFLTLFVSLGTLLCCVLPVVLVSFGLGTAVVALISHIPILVTLSQYKGWIFIISAVLLIITAWLIWWSSRSCPADPQLAALCERLWHWNKRIFWVALVIWVIAFMVTYIILPFWLWLEG